MKLIFVCAAVTALLSCSGESPEPPPSGGNVAEPSPSGDIPAAPAPVPSSDGAWESIASGEGTVLRWMASDGTFRMSVACLSRPARLVVNVPAFKPVMSEDRFALGLGTEPVTLVADPYAQEAGTGVTGEGPVPENFAAFIGKAAEVRALYGAQQTGPYPAPPAALKERLVNACSDESG